MKSVTSKDGTKIAFDTFGTGPVLLFVTGALSERNANHILPSAKAFSEHFTVYNYDRRGRGDSTDTLPYAVAREVEDIEALIDEAGGPAFVYGHSSGAALALEAAITLGNKIPKLAVYEAPYSSDEHGQKDAEAFEKDYNELMAQGKRGDAVALFLTMLGLPSQMIEGMRQSPSWEHMEKIAHTIGYENALSAMLVPEERVANIINPTLVMYGDKSYPFMKIVAESLSQAIPHVELKPVSGQDHNVSPEVLTPILVNFFKN